MAEEKQTVELYENQCCVCYAVFWQKKNGRLRRTCSAACRQKLYRMRHSQPRTPESAPQEKGRIANVKRKRVFPRAETHCPVCGAELVQPRTGRRRKTCSESCRKKLWRRNNLKCMICGKTFTPARFQKEHKYCSAVCRSRAREAMRWQRELAQRLEEVGSYQPEWIPSPGSGYRIEEVPWEEDADEEEAVVRERKPAPNHEEDYKTEAERQAERNAYIAAQEAETREHVKQMKKARKLARELLVDESKWWRW